MFTRQTKTPQVLGKRLPDTETVLLDQCFICLGSQEWKENLVISCKHKRSLPWFILLELQDSVPSFTK